MIHVLVAYFVFILWNLSNLPATKCGTTYTYIQSYSVTYHTCGFEKLCWTSYNSVAFLKRNVQRESCTLILVMYTPLGTGTQNTHSSRSITWVWTSEEIRTTSLHPAVCTLQWAKKSLLFKFIQLRKEGGGLRAYEDEELQIISRKAFCLNLATLTWDALRRLGDKQAMEKHKGKEKKKDNKLFHLNTHTDKSEE